MADYSRKWLIIASVAMLFVTAVSGCLSKTGATVDELTYNLPTALTIDRGSTLPGTDITYQSSDDKGIILLIDGQRALKSKGDSLNWKGSPVPGTDVDLDLRIVWFTEEQVHLAGKATVVVADVNPQLGDVDTDTDIEFTGPVAYGVAIGGHIPGSTMVYKGEDEQGAELSGLLNEYPYRQVGDSIFWEGKLRDQVYLRLALRVVQFDDRGLRVAGLATIWLGS